MRGLRQRLSLVNVVFDGGEESGTLGLWLACLHAGSTHAQERYMSEGKANHKSHVFASIMVGELINEKKDRGPFTVLEVTGRSAGFRSCLLQRQRAIAVWLGVSGSPRRAARWAGVRWKGSTKSRARRGR